MVSGPAAAPEPELGHGGFPRLSAQRCRSLLCSAVAGHLALSQDALPLVVPVSCAVVDDRLLVRAGLASLGRWSAQPGVVAFSTLASGLDHSWRSEVLVRGHAEVLDEPQPRDVPPPLSLLDSEHTTVLGIKMELVSGWHYGVPPQEQTPQQ